MEEWWLEEANRAVVEPRTFGHLPWLLRRRTVAALVRHVSWHIHTDAEAELEEVLDVLEGRLQEAPAAPRLLMGGPHPTSGDAVLLGLLAPMLFVPLPRLRLSQAVQRRPALLGLVQHLLTGPMGLPMPSLPVEYPSPPSLLSSSSVYFSYVAYGLIGAGIAFVVVNAWREAAKNSAA